MTTTTMRPTSVGEQIWSSYGQAARSSNQTLYRGTLFMFLYDDQVLEWSSDDYIVFESRHVVSTIWCAFFGRSLVDRLEKLM